MKIAHLILSLAVLPVFAQETPVVENPPAAVEPQAPVVESKDLLKEEPKVGEPAAPVAAPPTVTAPVVAAPSPPPPPPLLAVPVIATQKRELTDLQYMPNENQTKLILSFSQMNNELTTSVKSNGNHIVDQQTTQNEMDATAIYGITKELAATISWGYVSSGTVDSAYGAGSTLNGQDITSDYSGSTDPSIGFKLRANELESPHGITDLILSYSPGLSKHMIGTSKSDGNAGRGGDLVAVAVENGQKFSRFSYSWHIGFNYYAAQDGYNADTGVNTHVSPFSEILLGGLVQFNASDALKFQVGLTEELWSAEKATTAGSTDLNTESYMQTTFRLGIVDEIIPNKLALSAGYRKIVDLMLAGDTGGVDLSGTFKGYQWNVSLMGQF